MHGAKHCAAAAGTRNVCALPAVSIHAGRFNLRRTFEPSSGSIPGFDAPSRGTIAARG
jgi:hypothetical protein